jgi:MFS family permease
MRLPPRWAVAVSLAAAGTLPGDALLYAVLPILYADLGLELWMVGILLSANRFVRLATNPIAGRLLERAGVRGPFVAAVFASAATTAAYGLVSSFAALLAARVCWGACWSLLRLGGYLAALGASAVGSRGFALGFYNGVASAGTLLAVLSGGLLTDQIGFRATTLAYAAIALAAGVAILRERPPPQAADPGEPGEPVAANDPAPAPGMGGRRRRWAVYGLALVNGAAGSGLAVATLGLWLLETYGSTLQVATLALGVATVNGALLAFRFAAASLWSPAAGRLADRYGHLRSLLAFGAAAASCLAGLSLPLGLGWTVATAIGLFLAGTALRVTLDAAAGDLAAPASRARVLGWYASFSDLGAAAGPFLAYPLAVAFGLEWVYRGGAACLALAGGAAFWALRDRASAEPWSGDRWSGDRWSRDA